MIFQKRRYQMKYISIQKKRKKLILVLFKERNLSKTLQELPEVKEEDKKRVFMESKQYEVSRIAKKWKAILK